MHFLTTAFALMLGLASAVMTLVPTAAFAQTASSPQPLTSGAGVGPLSGAKGSRVYYALTVPAGAAQASFAITGNSGDCDIYVKYGAVPSVSTWDYRPYSSGSNETVTVSNPAAGTWYVMLRGYTAYSGVNLVAQHNASSGAVAATPVFNPAPGTYSGQVSVQLASTTPNAVIRFTLNGPAPTSSSAVYGAPILVTSTTQIQAAAFATNYTPSPVAAGTFTITNSVVTLANNTPISNLSGALGSVANFKFAVPAGAASVTFSITGSTGDADLYVKYGQLATTSVWDQRPYLSSSNETVTLNPPQVGDYFLMVHGYTAFSGLTIKATYSGTPSAGKPDIVFYAPTASPYITTEYFAPTACEIGEGTITAGTRKLLRFSTQSRNIGTADLVLGDPSSNPVFTWGACHGHWHFNSFAQYRLLYASSGAQARTGKKVGFCLLDSVKHNPSANPAPRYTCSNQGIQAGWADIYSSNLSGQWIDITGLPAGQYILEITMDPLNFIDELNETNNVTTVNVTIP